MKINFGTKEESNAKQIDDFLKLSKTDRIYAFINLSKKEFNFINFFSPNCTKEFFYLEFCICSQPV